MIALLLLPVALAASPTSVLTLHGGLTGLTGARTAGGLGYGAVRVNLKDAPVGVEAGAREGLVFGDQRTIGTILVTGRLQLDNGFTARLGFAHHHEVPWESFLEAPLLAIAGTGDTISHRSGLEGSVGWDAPLGTKLPRWHATADLFSTWLPDPGGPPLYVGLTLGLALDVGRAWDEAQ